MRASLKKVFFVFVLLHLFIETEAVKVKKKKQSEYIEDPFAEYTGYEGQDEEEDLENFYHFGRFFQIAVLGGVTAPFGGAANMITDGILPTFGARVSYFFDTQLTLDFGGIATSYTMALDIPNKTTPLKWYENLTFYNLGLRYYFEVIDLSRALALTNPYVSGGAVYTLRERLFEQATQNAFQEVYQQFQASTRSAPTMGFYVGAGMEFALYNKGFYVGAESRYHYIDFPDANTPLTVGDTVFSSQSFQLNYITINLILTINF